MGFTPVWHIYRQQCSESILILISWLVGLGSVFFLVLFLHCTKFRNKRLPDRAVISQSSKKKKKKKEKKKKGKSPYWLLALLNGIIHSPWKLFGSPLTIFVQVGSLTSDSRLYNFSSTNALLFNYKEVITSTVSPFPCYVQDLHCHEQ